MGGPTFRMPRLLCAMIFGGLIGAPAFAVGAPVHKLPREVRTFLDRREQCDHWTGEEPYDADRARDIAAAIGDLACERIDRDEAALRKRFARRHAIIAALDAAPKM